MAAYTPAVRLWSIHPRYLDRAGLVALWREGLLAQAVMAGRTRGYTHHPQLLRFRRHTSPLSAITSYLHVVADEGDSRGYHFDRAKLEQKPRRIRGLSVTDGQIAYEWSHLLSKLERRDPERHRIAGALARPDPHPLFVLVAGPVEEWERVRSD